MELREAVDALRGSNACLPGASFDIQDQECKQLSDVDLDYYAAEQVWVFVSIGRRKQNFGKVGELEAYLRGCQAYREYLK